MKTGRGLNSRRVLSTALSIALTVMAVVYDWCFILAISGLTVGGLYEFFYMVKKKDVPIYSYTGIFIGLLIPWSIYFQFELTKNWELLFIVCGFLTILLLQFQRRDNKNAILGLSTTLFGVLYVSWFFSFLVKIRLLLPDMQGVLLTGFIIAITKATDIGAIMVGSWMGKHPLMPKVSPNKTVEGTVGGILLSGCVAVLFRSWLPDVSYFTLPHVFLMGCFFGGLGQLGDLSESLIKRDCNMKDSGRLLPEMGGVLDMIDSLLFAVPAFYLYMSSTLNLL